MGSVNSALCLLKAETRVSKKKKEREENVKNANTQEISPIQTYT